MAVVHNHSPAVLPFAIAKGARFRPVCHMCGFLGDGGEAGAPLFEVRDTAGSGSDLLIRNRELGAALAGSLGSANFVLMRGHGCTVVAPSVRVAVYRAVYAEVNAQLLLQSLPLGEPEYLSGAEATAARDTCEGQIARPWNLWKQQAEASAA
jgi:HCOMODA/2-hydroxy-3-carboxy-muconic semialdehyde decarboxylase